MVETYIELLLFFNAALTLEDIIPIARRKIKRSLT
jgi:hypothetical protein